jgi:purine-nucleoside phosphorylase
MVSDTEVLSNTHEEESGSYKLAATFGDYMDISGPFADFRDQCRAAPPAVFVVLGSGMGTIIDRVKPAASLRFVDIPGLPSSSVQGHRGRLTLGEWAGRSVLVAEGRLHYYEGHSWDVVVRPIRLAAEMGARVAILTNAAGGIRADLGPGSLLPIRDHLEWNRQYPWRHPRQDSPYAPRLAVVVCQAGKTLGLTLSPGVYAALTGPNYETPAEIRALRAAGADAVGMSTSREIQAGTEAGLECGAVSLITNPAAGLAPVALDHAEVLAAASAAAERLGDLLEEVLRRV